MQKVVILSEFRDKENFFKCYKEGDTYEFEDARAEYLASLKLVQYVTIPKVEEKETPKAVEKPTEVAKPKTETVVEAKAETKVEEKVANDAKGGFKKFDAKK